MPSRIPRKSFSLIADRPRNTTSDPNRRRPFTTGRPNDNASLRATLDRSLKDAERLASDNPMGIATVVSVCPEEISCKARGIAYVNIPIVDAQPILTERFEEIMATIAEHIRFGTVLLMCAAGMSRSPIMAAAWLHRCGYVNFEGALQEIARVRPIIDPSPVLLKSVKEALSR